MLLLLVVTALALMLSTSQALSSFRVERNGGGTDMIRIRFSHSQASG
jgi:hypothetical protein